MEIVHVVERGATTYLFTLLLDDLGHPARLSIKTIPSRGHDVEGVLDFLSWSIGELFSTKAPLPAHLSFLVRSDGDPEATAEIRSVLEEVFDIIHNDLSHLPQAS